MLHKNLKAIIHVITFVAIAIIVSIFREKLDFLMHNKFDFLIDIFIFMIYWIITTSIDCFLDIKNKKKFKSLRR